MIPLIATLVLSPLGHGTPLLCPVMGSAANEKLAGTDLNGVRYGFCCGGCKATFEKSPAKYVTASRVAAKTVGAFLFDPVSGNRLEHAKAIAGFSDFGGVRFLFEKEANKAAFDLDPKRYGTLPGREALYCPISKEVVASYADASGYLDHKGIRYYMCCPGCETKFPAKADAYAASSTGYVKIPAVANPKVKG